MRRDGLHPAEADNRFLYGSCQFCSAVDGSLSLPKEAQVSGFVNAYVCIVQQGHHHNGDQAARRPHMTRSLWSLICDPLVWGTCVVGDGPIRQPPDGFLLAP